MEIAVKLKSFLASSFERLLTLTPQVLLLCNIAGIPTTPPRIRWLGWIVMRHSSEAAACNSAKIAGSVVLIASATLDHNPPGGRRSHFTHLPNRSSHITCPTSTWR